MAIIRLAWTNIIHRLSRSFITLAAMALAAAVLTAGLSMSQGMTKSAFLDQRVYFEGDITMFSPGFVGASPLSNNHRIVRHLLTDSGFNPIIQLYPDFLDKGYLADAEWSYRPFSSKDREEIAAINGVLSVESFKQMPISLAGRSLSLRVEPSGYAGYIVEGRQPKANADRLEIVLNKYSGIKAAVGDLVEVVVPAYSLDLHGLPYVDITLPSTFYNAVVVGLVSFPSRSIHWSTPQGMMQEDGYIHAVEAFVTNTKWDELWSVHSGGVQYPVLSVRIRAENMAEVKALTHALRAAFPQYAVFTIPEMLAHGFRYGLLDKYYLAPAWTWEGDTSRDEPVAPEDFGSLTSALLLLNAGLLMAGQMLASVASRRNEIGILKAIGARRVEIMVMILFEAVFLAVLGAFMGFSGVRFAAINQALTNGAPLVQVIRDSIREMSVVLGLAITAAVVFGMIPAIGTARLSVMEVFRRD